MKKFSWNVFAATGDIEAYLLYKEAENIESDEGYPSVDKREDEQMEQVEISQVNA